MGICTHGMSLQDGMKAVGVTRGNFGFGSLANFGAICEDLLRPHIRPDLHATHSRPDPTAWG
jgi:hypothetical protein